MRSTRAHRRTVLHWLAICSLAVALLFLVGCGDDLAGTQWKASVLGNDVEITFNDDETCTIEYGMVGMATEKRSGPYTAEGDRITIGEGDEMMELTRDGDTMKGTAQGIELTFQRQ